MKPIVAICQGVLIGFAIIILIPQILFWFSPLNQIPDKIVNNLLTIM